MTSHRLSMSQYEPVSFIYIYIMMIFIHKKDTLEIIYIYLYTLFSSLVCRLWRAEGRPIVIWRVFLRVSSKVSNSLIVNH